MSLTFSDRGVSPGETSFRTLAITLIALLSVVIVGVGAWGWLQGRLLRDDQSEDQSLHQRAGALVAVRSERAIEPIDIDQVRITPDVPFALEDDGLSIRLTFDQPLLEVRDKPHARRSCKPSGHRPIPLDPKPREPR